MLKEEYREAVAERDYWCDKPITHRTDDNEYFVRYDKPIGSIYIEDGYNTSEEYEHCIRHFVD